MTGFLKKCSVWSKDAPHHRFVLGLLQENLLGGNFMNTKSSSWASLNVGMVPPPSAEAIQEASQDLFYFLKSPKGVEIRSFLGESNQVIRLGHDSISGCSTTFYLDANSLMKVWQTSSQTLVSQEKKESKFNVETVSATETVSAFVRFSGRKPGGIITFIETAYLRLKTPTIPADENR